MEKQNKLLNRLLNREGKCIKCGHEQKGSDFWKDFFAKLKENELNEFFEKAYAEDNQAQISKMKTQIENAETEKQEATDKNIKLEEENEKLLKKLSEKELSEKKDKRMKDDEIKRLANEIVIEKLEPMVEAGVNAETSQFKLELKKKDIEMEAAEENHKNEREQLLKTIQQFKKANESAPSLLNQKTQGIVFEENILNRLEKALPSDKLTTVSNGKTGADIEIELRHHGKSLGTVLVECKKTVNWSDKWITKAIDDKIEKNAVEIIIVSDKFPKQFEGSNFQIYKDVWICKPDMIADCIRILKTHAIKKFQRELLDDKTDTIDIENVKKFLMSPTTRATIRKFWENIAEAEKRTRQKMDRDQRDGKNMLKNLDRIKMTGLSLIGDFNASVGIEYEPDEIDYEPVIAQ